MHLKRCFLYAQETISAFDFEDFHLELKSLFTADIGCFPKGASLDDYRKIYVVSSQCRHSFIYLFMPLRPCDLTRKKLHHRPELQLT